MEIDLDNNKLYNESLLETELINELDKEFGQSSYDEDAIYDDYFEIKYNINYDYNNNIELIIKRNDNDEKLAVRMEIVVYNNNKYIEFLISNFDMKKYEGLIGFINELTTKSFNELIELTKENINEETGEEWIPFLDDYVKDMYKIDVILL